MEYGDVVDGVKQCIANSLDIDPETINETDRIVGDLGADSLDLLDLTFGIEQRFGIRLSPKEIQKRTAARLGGASVEVDGVFTPEALAELRLSMPEVPPGELADGLGPARLPAVFRVSTMAKLVAGLLEAGTSENGETDA